MLSPGTHLGPYDIVSPLGAGGMGEVYRARDTRLDRTVAIKVLSPGLAATGEAQTRFEREARAVAALQHPHICTLFDVGNENGRHFLVMEYLEGETLAARLRRGPLPLAELVRLGGQIAAALARAHAAGIVHRDLKPGNIMLTASGAKLLDFGLAKSAAVESTGTVSPPSFTATLAVTAIHSPVTQAGTLIGTVQYMSPEQVEGRPADARSDIFALGCVLYEMATGAAAFEGASNLSLAAAILEKDPTPLRERLPLTPPVLDALIAACLRKSPDDRWQSAADVHTALAWGMLAAPAAAAAKPPRHRWLGPVLGVALGAAAVALAFLFFAAPPQAGKVIAEVPPPPGTLFNFRGSTPSAPAISPDGRAVAFVAHTPSGHDYLWLRQLDQTQARELPGTANAMLPFWSPDGSSIAYFTHTEVFGFGKLMILNLASGESRPLCDVQMARGGTWAPDGTILFAPHISSPIFRIPAAGGTAAPVTKLDTSQFSSDRYPSFLPDGKHFVYLAVNHADSTKDTLFFASLDGKINRPLAHSLTGAIYASGQLLYSVDGTLTAQSMDPASGALSGTIRSVATQVFDDPVSWRPGYSVSQTGVLVYATGSPGTEQLAWVDRSGKLTGILPAFPGMAMTGAVAPDGGRLAVSIDDGLQDIWIVDHAGNGRMRLTDGPVANMLPVWSRDGSFLIFGSSQGGVLRLRRRAASGANHEVVVGDGLDPNLSLIPGSLAPDGSTLLCIVVDANQRYSLTTLSLATQRLGTPLLAPGADIIANPSLSPDGRWAAYTSGPPGQAPNLFVVPLQGGRGAAQATTQGITNYFWAVDGKELDVLADDGTLTAVPVADSAGAPSFGAPHPVAADFPSFLAASPDGKSVLSNTFPNDHQRLMIVSHWNPASH
ncbi:MAG TPA: protein kinase [Terriglobales bacterium]|nr:protein kinase [Terriglobales bacterium]